jgi:hypothetical protein
MIIGQSPELLPVVGDDVDSSDAGVNDDVEHVLGMVALIVSLPCVHGLHLEEEGLHEDLSSLSALPHRYKGLVDLLGPVEVGSDDVLILVEGPAHNQELEQSQKQLLPLALVEDAEGLALLHEQTFPQLVAYLDLLVVLRHHLGDVALPHNFCVTNHVRSFYNSSKSSMVSSWHRSLSNSTVPTAACPNLT